MNLWWHNVHLWSCVRFQRFKMFQVSLKPSHGNMENRHKLRGPRQQLSTFGWSLQLCCPEIHGLIWGYMECEIYKRSWKAISGFISIDLCNSCWSHCAIPCILVGVSQVWEHLQRRAICWGLRCWSVSWWFLPRGVWNQHQKHQTVIQLQRVNCRGDLPCRSTKHKSSTLMYLAISPSISPSILFFSPLSLLSFSLSLWLFLAAFLPFSIPGCVGPVASFPLLCQSVLFLGNHRFFNTTYSLGHWWLMWLFVRQGDEDRGRSCLSCPTYCSICSGADHGTMASHGIRLKSLPARSRRVPWMQRVPLLESRQQLSTRMSKPYQDATRRRNRCSWKCNACIFSYCSQCAPAQYYFVPGVCSHDACPGNFVNWSWPWIKFPLIDS